jgi:hypothetical protein
VFLFCVSVFLSIGRGLATGWSPVQGVLPTVYRIKKLKKAAKDCRAIIIIIIIIIIILLNMCLKLIYFWSPS